MAPLNPYAPCYFPSPASFLTLPLYSSHFFPSPFLHSTPLPPPLYTPPPQPPSYQFLQYAPPPPPPPPPLLHLPRASHQPHLQSYDVIRHQSCLYYVTCCGVKGKVLLQPEELDLFFPPTTPHPPPITPPSLAEDPAAPTHDPPPVPIHNVGVEPSPPPSFHQFELHDPKRGGGRRVSGGSIRRSKCDARGFRRHGYTEFRRTILVPQWRINRRRSPGRSDEEFQFREEGEKQERVEKDAGEGGFVAKTTVMIKNIPNKYTKEMLLELIDKHCSDENQKLVEVGKEKKGGVQPVMSQFDFFYLPMDFDSGCNLGYGFVNFTSEDGAWRLHRAIHQKRWSSFSSRKICEVTYARIQGLGALMSHFKKKTFACESDDYLPGYFVPHRDGSCSWEHRNIGKRILPS